MDGVRTGIDRHQVAQVCDRFAEMLDGLGQPALWSARDSDIADIVRAAEQVARRAAAIQATAVVEALRRELPQKAAATGATAWLSGLIGAKPQHAHRVGRLASGLGRLPATAAALALGSIDADQAQVIATAVNELPDEVGAELRAKAEAYLLEQAAIHHAGILAGLAAHLLEVIAPELAEARLAEQLERDEARAERASNRLSAGPNHRGRMSVRGEFDPEAWATVAAALDRSPNPHPSTTPTGCSSRTPAGTASGSPTGWSSSPAASWPPATCRSAAGTGRRWWSTSTTTSSPMPPAPGCSTPASR